MSLETKFQLAEKTGAGFVRVDEQHRVDLYLAVDGGRRLVRIHTPHRPPELPALAAIHAELRLRPAGGWYIDLRLDRPDMRGLFTHLAEDLLAACDAQTGEPDPGRVVVERLSRWQRMLAKAPSGLLEDRELRGFLGELAFLLREAIPHFGAAAAIAGWVGPTDAPRDFVLPGIDVEVKAVHSGSRTIRVSSLHQLEPAPFPVVLWTQHIEVGSAPGASVADLVQEARAHASHDAPTAELLERRLLEAGFRDAEEYATRTVTFGAARCYRVVDDFPRLTRSLTALGVTSAVYELSLVALRDFETSHWMAKDGD